jgi:hypothetical protein
MLRPSPMPVKPPPRDDENVSNIVETLTTSYSFRLGLAEGDAAGVHQKTPSVGTPTGEFIQSIGAPVPPPSQG